MKFVYTLIATAIVATSFLAPSAAFAQAKTDQSKSADMKSETPKDMTEGEIRKVDKDAGKLTIKHGEIKNLAMPPMTMVFQVKERAMLDKVKTGDKVKFVVISENGKMIVTDIQSDK